MRPVAAEFEVSQGFGSMATAGVVGNINAARDTVEYYVGLYGNYQQFGHAGEDIACPVGTPVHAMAAGTVLWADWGANLPGDESDWGYRQRWYLYKGFPGIVTVIQHSWGKGVYAHLSSNDAAPEGTIVKEGQLIGYSGDTGGVAPHLHVEALINDSYVTQSGLIYGRTNPASFYGTITPQSAPIETKEWFEMPIGKSELLQIAAAVNNKAMRGAIVTDLLASPILSTDGKKWPLSAHVQGNTARTVEALARIAGLEELVKQVAAGAGTEIDYARIEASFNKSLAENTVKVAVTVEGATTAEAPVV